MEGGEEEEEKEDQCDDDDASAHLEDEFSPRGGVDCESMDDHSVHDEAQTPALTHRVALVPQMIDTSSDQDSDEQDNLGLSLDHEEEEEEERAEGSFLGWITNESTNPVLTTMTDQMSHSLDHTTPSSSIGCRRRRNSM